MDLEFHSSVIFVNDIEISKNFYCNILKQEIDNDFGNNVSLKCGLSLWQIPEWHQLNQNFYHKKAANKAFELYFETEDISRIVHLIDANHIKKHHDLIEESWGQKTIRIYDPDDNLIEIGEKLEVFILRLKKSGLNIQDIIRKTGVPLETIKKIIS